MHSLLAAFMGGFLLGFGITTGISKFVWGCVACLVIAGLLRWGENQEGGRMG